MNYRLVTNNDPYPQLVNRGRFQDMVIEANRGSEFRIFYEREPAEQWLASL